MQPTFWEFLKGTQMSPDVAGSSGQARSQAYASTQVLPHRFAKKKNKKIKKNKKKEREKDSKLRILKCTLLYI